MKRFNRLEFVRKPGKPLQPGEVVYTRARLAQLLGTTRAIFSKWERHADAPKPLAGGEYNVPAWEAFARKFQTTPAERCNKRLE